MFFSAMSDKFWWFPHMHSHLQPHIFDNLTLLQNDMLMNRGFAEVTTLAKWGRDGGGGGSAGVGECFGVSGAYAGADSSRLFS